MDMFLAQTDRQGRKILPKRVIFDIETLRIQRKHVAFKDKFGIYTGMANAHT